MSAFGLKFSQMILHTETSKLMYNWPFLFVVLHKPTLLPSTFNTISLYARTFHECECCLVNWSIPVTWHYAATISDHMCQASSTMWNTALSFLSWNSHNVFIKSSCQCKFWVCNGFLLWRCYTRFVQFGISM